MWKAGRIRTAVAAFRRSEAGYTYAAILIVLVGLALAVQTTWIPTSTAAQRAAEDELIYRGLVYASAVESYWHADPETPEFPPNLEALADDPRSPGRRHLRRLRAPSIGEDWRIIRADDGGIAGVAPVSDMTPFKRISASPLMWVPEDATTFSDWEFRFSPGEDE